MAISYTEGHKYQLAEPCTFNVNIYPAEDIHLGKIHLTRNGVLTIDDWYAWDGASGPAINTKNFRQGSLVHDALYQLLRWGRIPYRYREVADQELRRICIEDGMSRLRAWWVYKAVRFAGRSATMPSGRKRVHYAP